MKRFAGLALLLAACSPALVVDPAGQGFFDDAGDPVPRRLAYVAPADEACGWGAASILEIGWPPEDAIAGTATEIRFYVRDPESVVPPVLLEAPYDGGSSLDRTTGYTGLHTTTFQMWTGSDQDIYVYMVSGPTVEAWPRTLARPGC